MTEQDNIVRSPYAVATFVQITRMIEAGYLRPDQRNSAAAIERARNAMQQDGEYLLAQSRNGVTSL